VSLLLDSLKVNFENLEALMTKDRVERIRVATVLDPLETNRLLALCHRHGVRILVIV
jgi:hypothetical protein